MRRLVAILAAVAALNAGAAEQTLFKCKRADGSTEYTAQPCEGSKTVKIGSERDDWVGGYGYGAGEPPWHVVMEPVPEATMTQCLTLYRPRLKDPGSGSVETGIYVENARGRQVVVQGRAKNSFGALGIIYFVCPLDRDGAPVGTDETRGTSVEKYGVDIAYHLKPRK